MGRCFFTIDYEGMSPNSVIKAKIHGIINIHNYLLMLAISTRKYYNKNATVNNLTNRIGNALLR